ISDGRARSPRAATDRLCGRPRGSRRSVGGSGSMKGGTLPLAVAIAMLVSVSAADAQVAGPTPGGAAPAPAAQQQTDSLGRDTPRGTLIGFMTAVGRGNLDAAVLYLDANPHDRETKSLAQELYAVLDARLPPRLAEVSDRPEGSRSNPLHPDQDVIGTISTAAGPLDLICERVAARPSTRLWPRSPKTLDALAPV